MRRLLILGCFLVATVVTGCSDALFVADLECGKDGKLRGDLELVFFGNEQSQAELDDASCEDLKELKQELKQIKLAVGYEDEGEFVPVVYSKKYEVEDENCDGYTDISWEFKLKKLVCAGIFDENTTELALGIYVKDDCEWVLDEYGYIDVKINYDCDDDCEDSKDDCDYDNDNDCEKSYDCEDSSNGDGEYCEKSYDCDDDDGWTKDCDDSSNGDSYDCDKEEKSYDCEESSNGDGEECEKSYDCEKESSCDNEKDCEEESSCDEEKDCDNESSCEKSDCDEEKSCDDNKSSCDEDKDCDSESSCDKDDESSSDCHKKKKKKKKKKKDCDDDDGDNQPA